MKILIKNGKLVDPANDIDAFYDVLIEEDKVARVSQDIDPNILGEGDSGSSPSVYMPLLF